MEECQYQGCQVQHPTQILKLSWMKLGKKTIISSDYLMNLYISFNPKEIVIEGKNKFFIIFSSIEEATKAYSASNEGTIRLLDKYQINAVWAEKKVVETEIPFLCESIDRCQIVCPECIDVKEIKTEKIHDIYMQFNKYYNSKHFLKDSDVLIINKNKELSHSYGNIIIDRCEKFDQVMNIFKDSISFEEDYNALYVYSTNIDHSLFIRHDLFDESSMFIHIYNKERKGYIHIYNEDSIMKYSIQNRIVHIKDQLRYTYFYKYITNPQCIKNQSYLIFFLKLSTHPCRCIYKNRCEDQFLISDQFSSITEIEKKHVLEFYDSLYVYYSTSFLKYWKPVTDFIDTISKDSLILDYGCGEGKYMDYCVHKHIHIHGIDLSKQMISIYKRGIKNTNQIEQGISDVIVFDCLRNKLRSNIYDYILCTSVLIHIYTPQNRYISLKNMVDMLAIGGKAILSVWSLENIDNSIYNPSSMSIYSLKSHIDTYENDEIIMGKQLDQKEINKYERRSLYQDNCISWTGVQDDGTVIEEDRYIYLYLDGEIEWILSHFQNIKIISKLFYKSNYIYIFEKTNEII
ncbi:hypothetical protein WA158_002643 [Blastocystis sp. Blastoise]